jgi:hypothetical protein
LSDELIAQALIGDEARKFLESDLGKCLIGMANQEAEVALEALSKVNPTDVQAIERLQNRIWLARHFEAFVRELMQEGDNALARWRQSQTQNVPE